jgi:ubiquinone/menaquinone biosynthesis C-methylase UbiE
MMNEADHIRVNKEKWNKWAESADGKGLMYEYLRKAQSSVISLLETKENMSFLDIGCGTGWAIGQAAKAIGANGTFYGVDLSPKMIDKAKENFNGYPNFHFIVCSSESIQLDDNMFDAIICTNSFHHYLNPGKAMGEMYRLLRGGGKLYILDPTADTWTIKFADKIIKLFEPQHVKLYSTNEFRNLMVGAGLKYIESRKIQGRESVHIASK